MSEPGIYDLERLLKGSGYEAALRAAIIEECALLVEDRRWGVHTPLEEIAAAIRASKDKP